MQKSNDNEIVQYLGVKHIINYLEVQVGLTQTSHFQGYLQYDVWGIWGGWGFNKPCLGLSQTVYIHRCTHMSRNVCVWKCVRACAHVNIRGWVLACVCVGGGKYMHVCK